MANISDAALAEIIANSFKNFHAKGLHYFCLRRHPQRTVKAYFYDGDAPDSADLVIPHDHRYAFHTTVLAGAAVNVLYTERLVKTFLGGDEVYQRFDYLTPLNGGSGFTWHCEAVLRRRQDRLYVRSQSYYMEPDQIHTLRVRPGTVLLLVQYADQMPIGQPTRAYSKKREPPSLDGLYEKPKPDDIAAWQERLAALAGSDFVERALGVANG